MSIVALKRKSLTQFGKGHVDKKGVFSLNGAMRHPPPTLGRSIQPTPMKGPEPKVTDAVAAVVCPVDSLAFAATLILASSTAPVNLSRPSFILP